MCSESFETSGLHFAAEQFAETASVESSAAELAERFAAELAGRFAAETKLVERQVGDPGKLGKPVEQQNTMVGEPPAVVFDSRAFG